MSNPATIQSHSILSPEAIPPGLVPRLMLMLFGREVSAVQKDSQRD